MKNNKRDLENGEIETAGIVSSTEMTGMMAAQITDDYQAENFTEIYDVNKAKAPKMGRKK